jgi:hypothetical protein
MATGGKVNHYNNIEMDIITICLSFSWSTLAVFVLRGSQAHFITKRTWWFLLGEQGKQEDHYC